MKFNQLSAFEKHLTQSDPSHLSDVYLIVDPEPYMQRKLAQSVAQKNEVQEIFSAETLTLGKLREALDTPSLFEPHKCCVILGVEKLPKNCLAFLKKNIENPYPQIRLVLTASQMSMTFSKLAKHLIALDLSMEKPWDKERRLAGYVSQTLKKANLFISSTLAEQVVKRSGSKVSYLDQELEKLICYLKGKKEVKQEDLNLLQNNLQLSIFKIGEALLEHRVKDAISIRHHIPFPTPLLIYSLRNLFQRSLRLKELPSQEAQKAFPNLKGKLFEKSVNLTRNFSKESFKKALLTLFELEVKMKNQKIDDDFLQSLLLLKLGAL